MLSAHVSFFQSVRQKFLKRGNSGGGGGGLGEYKNENYCVFLERNEIKKGKTIFFLTGNVPISFTLHGFFVILFRYFGNRIESVLSS